MAIKHDSRGREVHSPVLRLEVRFPKVEGCSTMADVRSLMAVEERLLKDALYRESPAESRDFHCSEEKDEVLLRVEAYRSRLAKPVLSNPSKNREVFVSDVWREAAEKVR